MRFRCLGGLMRSVRMDMLFGMCEMPFGERPFRFVKPRIFSVLCTLLPITTAAALPVLRRPGLVSSPSLCIGPL